MSAQPRILADRIRFVRSALFACFAAALAVGAPAAASITGVCPDGSMYIVPRAELIPCPNSKTVNPTSVPPIRPEYLPQPYGWEVLKRKSDPNNPYNLIGSEPAPEGERATGGAPEPRRATSGAAVPEPERREHAAIRSAPGAPIASEVPMPQFEDGELDDLAMIVELSQRRAPAAIFDGDARARVRLARSAAFEARIREYLDRRGQPSAAPVLLFLADGSADTAFYGNLTFVQSGIAFHPDRDDSLQLGVIRGRLGPLEAGGHTLGYVVLPDRLDLSRPMDIYWNDRQVTATLRP